MFVLFWVFLCWNAVECKPVPTCILNPKACGVQGCSPEGGCGGGENFRHFFIEIFFKCKHFFCLNRLKRTQKLFHWNRKIFFFWSCDIFHFLGCIEMIKSTISQKPKIAIQFFYGFSSFSKHTASLRIIKSKRLFLRGRRSADR